LASVNDERASGFAPNSPFEGFSSLAAAGGGPPNRAALGLSSFGAPNELPGASA